MAGRQNEYFIPEDGIDEEVITTDICRYLGNDASVRPGTYEAMIQDLKVDSAQWQLERAAYQQAERLSNYSLSENKSCKESDGKSQRRIADNLNARHGHGLEMHAPVGSSDTLHVHGRSSVAPTDIRSQYSSGAYAYTVGGTDSGYASLPRGLSKPPDTRAADSLVGDTHQEASSDIDISSSEGRSYAATVYSEAPNLNQNSLDVYKSELADSLSNRLQAIELTRDRKGRMADLLPDMLRRFALRLGQHSTNKSETEIMYFVHKYRHEIARRFRDTMLPEPDENTNPREQQPVHKEVIELSVKSWLNSVQTTDAAVVEPSDVEPSDFHPVVASYRDEEPDLEFEPEVTMTIKPDKYRDIAFQSPAFEWLLSSLNRELTLSSRAPDDAVTKLKTRILDALPKTHAVSSTSAATTFTMEFKTRWNIRQFIGQEYRNIGKAVPLGEIITLTGSPTDAQALPCSQYLEQTWPCTGHEVLSLVQAALDTGVEVSKRLQDRTHIYAKISDDSILAARVSGTADVIAEIGEQIAWLACALRSSGSKDGAEGATSYYSPIVKSCPRSEGHAGIYMCEIDFAMVIDYTNMAGSPSISNGSCWQSMFRNPVVVAGYPIRQRPCGGTGLEIPLTMMGALVRSTRLSDFLGKSFLKGFSSMLVAVERVSDIYIWHHHYNADGSHVSYLEAEGFCAQGGCNDIPAHDMASARHIVGWSANSEIWAGSPRANYSIRQTGLPRAGREFALEKVSFSCGQFLTGGCTFGIGRKDTPIHISKASYIDKLRWISQKYTVLWDEEDKRGWMLNGATTLLHLLRGSLEHSRTDKFKSQFIFDFSKLKDSSVPLRPDSAIDVLVNPDNRRLPLYPAKEETYTEISTTADGTSSTTVTKTKTTYKTLENKVEELYECLEKVIEHKAQTENPKGLSVKSAPRLRRHLEGWEFHDMATGRDPIYLKVATLPASAFSWVEFTRATQVVTLFGRGFGYLITPTESSNPVGTGTYRCAQNPWNKVPRDKHYLCVSVPDLQEIIEDSEGSVDLSAAAVTIAPGLSWTNPSKTSPFAPDFCQCLGPQNYSRGNHAQLHTSPVQHIIPSKVCSILSMGTGAIVAPGMSQPTYQHGAVIFGQGSGSSEGIRSLRWIWPEIGNTDATGPSATEPPPPTGTLPEIAVSVHSDLMDRSTASNSSNLVSSTSQSRTNPPQTPLTVGTTAPSQPQSPSWSGSYSPFHFGPENGIPAPELSTKSARKRPELLFPRHPGQARPSSSSGGSTAPDSHPHALGRIVPQIHRVEPLSAKRPSRNSDEEETTAHKRFQRGFGVFSRRTPE
ncbi:hypothetical protein QBC44DRAFT_368771 [Cladorrhinum sp. PSN332]|nr:hypothetical protein QBC44DRAFT_368771 [Cladorrhinum sp. PSN332]